jgi:hypothetical protein
MSAHATPVLSGAIPTFKLFMTQWENIGKKFQNLKPWTDIGLKWANKYYNRMDDTRAYIVAMCELSSFYMHIPGSDPALATVINPCICFSWIEREWDDDYKEFAKKTVLDVVSELNMIYLHIDNLQLKM